MRIARRIRFTAALAMLATLGAGVAAAGPASAATPACIYVAGAVDPGCTSAATSPVITVQPADQTTTDGGTATFVARASGGNALPSEQWIYSFDGGNSWNTLGGDTAPTLTLQTSLAENGDEVEAVFTNAMGTTISRAATLTVLPGPTTTTLTSSANPSFAGDPVTFEAGVAPVPDAGTVTFAADGVDIPGCENLPPQNGAALCDILYVDASQSLITATYSGGDGFLGSASNAIEQTIVVPVAPAFAAVQLPALGVGEPVNYQFATSGTPAPVMWVSAGTLPAGLHLSTDGTLSGTPTAAGRAAFTLTASNGFGAPATVSVSSFVRARPTLSISAASIAEGNRGTHPMTFTVHLSRASTVPVAAHWATANGTAVAGSDYRAAVGTVTIQPGSTTASVTVTIIGDTKVEGNETFTVKLSAPKAALLGPAIATGTIRNDD
jgi:hypothetical protein